MVAVSKPTVLVMVLCAFNMRNNKAMWDRMSVYIGRVGESLSLIISDREENYKVDTFNVKVVFSLSNK